MTTKAQGNSLLVTADILQTLAADIKAAYESNADTNAYDDAAAAQLSQLAFDVADLANTIASISIPAAAPAPITKYYHANNTWFKPAGLKAIKVIVVAAGGGRSPSVLAGHSYGSGGGGGTAIRTIQAVDLTAQVAITVGLGVSSGNGGGSSFGTYCSATGGTAGAPESGPGGGGDGGGGDFNIPGQEGGGGTGFAIGGPNGGTSYFGGTVGAGGGHSSPGGAGYDGIVVVEEYY